MPKMCEDCPLRDACSEYVLHVASMPYERQTDAQKQQLVRLSDEQGNESSVFVFDAIKADDILSEVDTCPGSKWFLGGTNARNTHIIEQCQARGICGSADDSQIGLFERHFDDSCKNSPASRKYESREARKRKLGTIGAVIGSMALGYGVSAKEDYVAFAGYAVTAVTGFATLSSYCQMRYGHYLRRRL